MLAIAGVIGMVTQSRRARADFRKSDGEVKRAQTGRSGIGNAGDASAPQLQNLKLIGPEGRVLTVRHRDAAFEIRTADGRSRTFRQTDLRIKIDSSDYGPPAGAPVILPGGMKGDRATLFVASPTEISMLIA